MKRSNHIKLKFLWVGMLFIILPSFHGFSQNHVRKVDSLEALAAKEESDKKKVSLWNEIALVTAPVDRVKNEEIHLSIIDLCQSKLEEETDSAEVLFYQQQLAKSHTALGVNYFMNANFNSATISLLNSIQLSKEIKAYDLLARAYTVRGVIQRNLENFPSSYESFKLAVLYSDSAQSFSAKALAYNNIAINNLDQDSINQAITYFEKTRQLYEIEENYRGVSVALINLGSCYKKQKEYESAILMFKRSIVLRESINDKQGLIFSHHRLGEAYFTIDSIDLAKTHAKKSLELANEKGYPRGLRDANELLFLINKKENKSADALYHYEQYITARDSLVNKENIREITKLEEQYLYAQKAIRDSLKNEEKVKTVQLKLEVERANSEKQTVISLLLGLVIVLILVLVGFVFSQYKKTNRQKIVIEKQKKQVDQSLKELSIRNEEKEVLLKEIHHRVKNNLQVVIALLELQDSALKDAQFSEAVKISQQRVRSMALIHELLYKNEDVGKFVFSEYIQNLLQQVRDSYANRDTLEYTLDFEKNVQFDLDTAIPLGLIITELFTNAAKYGADDNGRIKVSISCKKISEKRCLLTVRDTGQGLAPNFELSKAKSLGVRLVHKLAKQLKGTVDYHFDHGAVFSITFTHD